MDATPIRHLIDEVDDAHRSALADLPAEIGDTLLSPAGRSRRALLTGFGLVSAGTLLAATASPAAAADATTTTAPPKAPSDADLVLLAWVQSLELAAAQAYGVAASTGKLNGDAKTLAAVFQRHHNEHAQAFAALAGAAAPGKLNNAILAAYVPKFAAAADQNAVLTLALAIENATAATYATLVGTFQGVNPAATAASILPVEARHAVVIAHLLGLPLDQSTPVRENADGSSAFDPAKYPIQG